MKNVLLFSFIFIYSCAPRTENREEYNKQRILDYYEQVVNAHNADMIDSFVTKDFTDSQMDSADKAIGSEGLKNRFKDEFFAAFPDGHVEPHFLIASGDTVVANVTLSGTNTGSTQRMQATNKKVSVEGTAIFILRDGKIAKRWRYFDDLLMMQQLGLLPTEEVKTDSSKGK